MLRFFMQFSACFALGLVVSGLILIGLMFFGQFDLIHGLNVTGKPLAWLALEVLPDGFWERLTGLTDAAGNPHVRSFLALCAALGQVGLLLALGFMRLWYRS